MADVSMPNYGLLGGLAEGLKQGLISYQNTKNIERNNQMQNMLMGVQKNPETGAMEYTPQKSQELALQKAKTGRELGLQSGGTPESQEQIHSLQQAYDAAHSGDKTYHGPRGADIFPETMSGVSATDLAGKGLIGKELSGEMGIVRNMFSPIAAVKTRQIDEGVHKGAVDDVSDKNKNVSALQTTYQNLNNAIKNFKQGGATSQEFNELQQAVRSNAGIKGQGGVSERADTYLKSQGLRWQDLEQFWTGDPKSVLENNPKLAEVILNVANLELENKRSQAFGQIDKASKKHQSFYSAPGHESYAKDFTDTKNAELSQFDLGPDGKPLPPAPGLLGAGTSPAVPRDDAAKVKRMQELRAKAAAGNP
jgi:hypothetical protein